MGGVRTVERLRVMLRERVERLYFITDMTNVPSMLARGLLSHNGAAMLPHVDISLESVQGIRATKRVPGGLVLHDYAPLYFCARNPMLNIRMRTMLDELCVLGIHESVLDLDGVVIADHNAAAHIAGFAPSPEGLEDIDETLTFARFWTHEDCTEYERRKKRMCAEVLVPHGIHPSFIEGAYVGTRTAEASFKALGTGLPCQLDRDMFFQ